MTRVGGPGKEADAPGTEAGPVHRTGQALQARTGVAAYDAVRLSAAL